jgi:hypothetical protein
MLDIGKRLNRMNNKNMRTRESAGHKCIDENCTCNGRQVAESTKLTKSELRQMIREVLQEELAESSLNEDVAEAFDKKQVMACLARVNSCTDTDIQDDYLMFSVKLSMDDLKKALKLGAYGLFTHYTGPMPAQIVDAVALTVGLEIGEPVTIALQFYGEDKKTGMTAHEYLGDEIPLIGFKELNITPNSIQECRQIIQDTIKNAESIAHEIIDNTWKESGFTDYSGITSYDGNPLF